MYSSKMRTIRCSGRHKRGVQKGCVCVWGGCVSRERGCVCPWGCVWGVSRGGVCVWVVCSKGGVSRQGVCVSRRGCVCPDRGGVSRGGCVCPEGVCVSGGIVCPEGGMCVQGVVCLEGVCVRVRGWWVCPEGCAREHTGIHPPMDRIPDTRM